MNRGMVLGLVILSTLALAACGTLELGVERGVTPEPPVTVVTKAVVRDTATSPAATPAVTRKATATSRPPASATPEPTFTPTPEAVVLHIAFVRDGNPWLLREGDGAKALGGGGEVSEVKISDDGQTIAFRRGDELWAVESDGTDERPLVTEADLEAMAEDDLYEPQVAIYRFDWIPGTHTLAFSTRLRTEIGLVLREDLYLVDVDTREQKMLLPPGRGGEVHFSPDGRQLAVATTSSVYLIDADGGNRRDVLAYTPPMIPSEALTYARPAWAADSKSLRVAIPPAEPVARPSQPSAIWLLPADGSPAVLLGEVTAAPRTMYVFSPDMGRVAYLGRAEGTQPGGAEGVMITDLDTWETVTPYPQAHNVYEWSPDSQRFAFATGTQRPQALLGQLGQVAVPAHSDLTVAFFDLRWVDADRYLYLAQSTGGWDIVLGEVGGRGETLVALSGRQPAYDHTLAADRPGE